MALRPESSPSLFDSVPESPILRVGDLTRALKEVLEGAFSDLWVEGELSNVKMHQSGHCYFSLKDERAQLQGVMWRSTVRTLAFEPRDGMLVRAHGRVTVYEPRGQVQLVADQMQPAGVGALQQAFEAMKRRLAAEGLFDSARKRTLPPFPAAIGLVTSADGAALHDMLTVIGRRFPLVHVFLCPVRVQGPGAMQQVSAAIARFNEWSGTRLPPIDVLIVGRGGGSIEDLWAFNEEMVARAIYASEIPVVSAVGHETDFTIADFVADVRAATPSMAAELAVPDRQELAYALRRTAGRLTERLRVMVRDRRFRVHSLVRSYGFRRPVDRLDQAKQRTDEQLQRMDAALTRLLDRKRTQVGHLAHRIEMVDPRAPLVRGYVRVERDRTAVVRAGELRSGDLVSLRFVDGAREARVTEDNP